MVRALRPPTVPQEDSPHVHHRRHPPPRAGDPRQHPLRLPCHHPGGRSRGRREGHLSPPRAGLPARLRPLDARQGQGLLRRGRTRGRVQDRARRRGRREAGGRGQRGHRWRDRRHAAHRAGERDPGEGGRRPRGRVAHDPRHRPGGGHRSGRGPEGPDGDDDVLPGHDVLRPARHARERRPHPQRHRRPGGRPRQHLEALHRRRSGRHGGGAGLDRDRPGPRARR